VFRCVQEILNLAHALCDKNESIRQIASRGKRKELPMLIHVGIGSTQSSSPTNQKQEKDIPEDLLRAMLDASLEQIQKLPSRDKGSIAFIVALSKWSERAIHYLKNEKLIPIIAMENTYHYQSFHVDLMLTYLRLICDKSRDRDVERLLLHCLHPSLSREQLQVLQEQASMYEQTLMEAMNDDNVLQQCALTPEQYKRVCSHIAVVNTFTPDNTVGEVWETSAA
jgi:superfamily I DNA/RNA helicase